MGSGGGEAWCCRQMLVHPASSPMHALSSKVARACVALSSHNCARQAGLLCNLTETERGSCHSAKMSCCRRKTSICEERRFVNRIVIYVGYLYLEVLPPA